MSVCKSCKAKIKWVETFYKRMMPVDAEEIDFYPDPAGGDIFVTDGGAVVHGIRADKGAENAHKGYISHFATCPNADAHRRRRK